VKLHLLIALGNLAILNLNITKGTRNDSPILEKLLKPIPKGVGDTCLDPAYLSRQNCNLITMKGRTPIIKPKRNTTIRKRGSQPWRDMITLWFEDQTTFLKRYHQRSKAESVYSSLKRCYGNYLSSHKRKAQRRELHLRTLTYNIGVDNLTNIREQNGKLSTPVSILVSRNNFTTRIRRFMVKLNERKIRWIIHEKLRGRGAGELALIQRVSHRRVEQV
jgi:hypothetical protein